MLFVCLCGGASYGESFSSGLFCYALALGINEGYLDRARCEPAVLRAWKGLCACVYPDGGLGYALPPDERGDYFTPDSTTEGATGAFLLAGEQVLPIISQAN